MSDIIPRGAFLSFGAQRALRAGRCGGATGRWTLGPTSPARKLAGLASRPELNGLSCIVQGYDAGSGRYRVEYEAAGVRAMISVQPGKLGAAMPPPPRAPNSQRERLDAHKHGRR